MLMNSPKRRKYAIVCWAIASIPTVVLTSGHALVSQKAVLAQDSASSANEDGSGQGTPVQPRTRLERPVQLGRNQSGQGPLAASENEPRRLIDQAAEAMRVGKYDKVIELANEGVNEQVWNERWPLLLIEAHMMVGQYREAKGALEASFERFGDHLGLRLLGIRVYQKNNETRAAKSQMQIIDRMIQQAPWRYTTATELVALGEYFLLRGEDPKLVLEACFDQSLKVLPDQTAAHIATAEMALEKGDAKVASQALSKALGIDEGSPHIYYLLFKAWRDTDRKKATDYLRRSLEINNRYVPSLVALAEEKLNEESYEDAEVVLAEIEQVNSRSSQLWALRAVAAHLQGDYLKEGEFRTKALADWSLDPEIDHTIGRHLGMHYRFKESVDYQRRALKMDANYVPAQTQLAQDLLRLGEEEEGWRLVEQVRAANPYDVTIYNLKQLQKAIDRMVMLEIPGFIVRMDAKEANIYGSEVLSLLKEARETLTQKYKVQLEEPIYVEIFPKQRDFAIRTFGLPGGEGFLGVCFGRLITANSPAALSVDSNWKSVLWHEYCHVVTLQKTKNKMPRWLSEGISVYEETLKNSTWGQPLDPTYRKMLLGEDYFPISDLSSAFMKAKTPLHLQFAYYESSVAVEFFVNQYGFESLLKVLDDLAVGMPANDALRRAPGSLEALDAEFDMYAKQVAEKLGNAEAWIEPDSSGGVDLSDWAAKHPESFWSLSRNAKEALLNEDWNLLLEHAQKIKQLWPADPREDGAYALMALAHRKLGDLTAEREALVQLVEKSSSAIGALTRLCQIDSQQQNWDGLLSWSQSWIDIMPLSLEAQRHRAMAATHLGQWEPALQSWQACLALEPIDESRVRYQIADSLFRLGRIEEAREMVLLALEESPRYPDALKLLVTINRNLNNLSEPETSEDTGDELRPPDEGKQPELEPLPDLQTEDTKGKSE